MHGFDGTSGSPDGIPDVTRRQALAGLGLGGLLGLGAADVGTAGDESLDGEQANWTARHRQRVARDAMENRYETADEVVYAGEKHASLDYLGASWSKFGNPAPGSGSRGAWRHTFLLSNFVALQSARETYPLTRAGDVSGYRVPEDPSYFLDESFSVVPSVEVRASGAEGDDPPRQPNVAVSAVRDRDLYGFVDPESLVAQFDELDGESADADAAEVGSSDVQAYLDGIATGGPSDPVNWNDVLQTAREVQDRRDDARAAFNTILIGISLSTPQGAAAVGLYELGSFLAGLLGGSETGDPPVPFYDGFEQEFRPEASGPIASAFVTFDVYVAPETGDGDAPKGSVDVSTLTTAEFDDETAEFESTWTVEVTGSPPPDDPDRAARPDEYTAEIVDLTAPVPVEADGSEGIRSGETIVDRSPRQRPQPVITPPPEITTPADEPEEPLVAGETYRFSARETLRCGASIPEEASAYEWSVEDLGAPNAYDDVSGGAVIDLQIAETSFVGPTVELTVTDDADAQGTTRRTFLVGGGPEISPRIERLAAGSPEPLVVGADAQITGSSSTAEAGIDAYEWRIESFPPDFPDSAERYRRTGTRETFRLPTVVPGEYEVTLEVTDETGRSERTTRTFAVATTEPSAEIVDPDDLVPRGTPVQLRVDHTGFAGGVAESEVTWRVDGDPIDATGLVATHEFEQADETAVSVEATVPEHDGEGEATAETVLLVEDQSGPLLAHVEGPRRPALASEGDDASVTYRAVVEGARDELDYRWSVTAPGDGNGLPSDSGFEQYEPPRESGMNDRGKISGSFAAEGERRVEVSVSDAAGASATDATTVHAGSVLNVSLDAPDEVDADEPATLTATVEDARHDVELDWSGDLPEGGDYDGDEVTVEYAEPRVAEVTVTASELAVLGQQASATVEIDVDEPESVSIEADPEPVDAGEEVTLRAELSAFEDPPDYRWQLPDAADFGLSYDGGLHHPQSISGTFGLAGDREVSVTASDGEDEVARSTRDVDVEFTVDLTVDRSTVWTGDTATFDTDVAGAHGTPEYDWTNVDADGPTASKSWSEPGRHVVEVEARDGGRSATSSVVVEVRSVELEIRRPLLDVKEGKTVSFQAEVVEAQGAVDFDWSVEDGDFDLSGRSGFDDPATIDGEFTSPGDKEVTVRGLDAHGHAGSESVVVDVEEVTPIDVDLSADATRVEVGTQVTFTASISNATGPPDPTWIGTNGSGTETTESWNSPGTYDVAVEVDDGETSDRDEVSVTVVAPDPELGIDPSTDGIGSQSWTLKATTAPEVSPASYTWFVDGERVGSGPETTAMLDVGNNEVRVEITYAGGETASETTTVDVPEVGY